MVRSRRAWRQLVVRAGLVLGAAGVVWWLVGVVRVGELSASDQVSHIIGLVGLVLGVVSFREQRRQGAAKGEDDSVRLDRAADTLAEAVRRQWEAEAGRRAVDEHRRLPLRWETTDRPVAVPIASVAGGATAGRVLGPRGHLDQVADDYLALPHKRKRLVVLGEPGAGKTVLAMLLTLELLDPNRREELGRVAILTGLAAWDPTAEHLHTWLARRLNEDYPALKHPSFGPDAALELVTSGRVLPVLDGLDELPEPLRAQAIGGLEQDWAGRPLILTCRSQEYERAVEAGGQVLAAAGVVELVPVSAAEAIGYLRAAGPFVARWDRVAAHVEAQPEGALAGALSTPLMVALARTIYTVPDRDPGELVELAIAEGRAAVEGRLLEGFIPAAYTRRPSAPGTPAPRLQPPPSHEVAGRWLGVLAGHLQQQGTGDLAWWQLRNLLPRRTRRLVGGLGFGLVVGLAAGLDVGLAVRLVVGLGVGLAFGLMLGLVDLTLSPARVNTQLRGRVGDLLWTLGGWLVFGLVFGLACALVVGLRVGLAVGLVFGLFFGFMLWVQSPGLDAVAVTPNSVLRSDRAHSLSVGLGGGLVAGIVAGVGGGLGVGLVVGLVVGLAFALFLSAWGTFALARGWLALQGRLPWRLMAFLADAYDRGVLRRVGAVYQFRHARLQDHLTATSRAAAPDDP